MRICRHCGKVLSEVIMHECTGRRMTPRSHTDDPVTSREAESSSAKLASVHMRLVERFVGDNPGCTSSRIATELAFRTEFSVDQHTRLYQVRRRLSDLRTCTPPVLRRGEKLGREVTWWPATKQETPE